MQTPVPGIAASRFQFTGDVLAIEQEEVVCAVSVLVGNQIVTVIATAEDGLVAATRVIASAVSRFNL